MLIAQQIIDTEDLEGAEELLWELLGEYRQIGYKHGYLTGLKDGKLITIMTMNERANYAKI